MNYKYVYKKTYNFTLIINSDKEIVWKLKTIQLLNIVGQEENIKEKHTWSLHYLVPNFNSFNTCIYVLYMQLKDDNEGQTGSHIIIIMK